MKKLISLLVCALILVAPAANAQSSSRRYTIKGEEFSVILPAMPALITSEGAERKILKASLGRHLRTVLDDVRFSIDVFDNPQGQSLEELVAAFKAKDDFTAERNIVINGVPGKEYSKGRSVPAIAQFFATERRLYRFIAFGDDIDSAVVKQFFSSIILGQKTDAIEVNEDLQRPLLLNNGERIYSGKEVDTRAKLISKPEPMYTEEARKGRTRGRVVLKAVFSSTGEVTDIQVVSALPNGLTEACINAAKKIEFVPAVKDGKPVSTWITLEYNFM